jgi:hypothetical protein
MGNQNQPPSRMIESIRSDYVLTTLSNPAYGRGQVYQNKFNQTYIIEKVFFTEQRFWTYLEKLQGKSDFIIKFIGENRENNDNLCSAATSVSVYYEFVPHNLEELKIQSNKIYFPQVPSPQERRQIASIRGGSVVLAYDPRRNECPTQPNQLLAHGH